LIKFKPDYERLDGRNITQKICMLIYMHMSFIQK